MNKDNVILEQLAQKILNGDIKDNHDGTRQYGNYKLSIRADDDGDRRIYLHDWEDVNTGESGSAIINGGDYETFKMWIDAGKPEPRNNRAWTREELKKLK